MLYDTGEQSDFLTAQPLDATVSAVGRQPCLLGCDASTTGAEEFADLGSVVHAVHVTRAEKTEGGTAVTWNNRHSRAREARR